MMICLENKVQYEVSQDIYKGMVLLIHLEIVKVVTKEILR